MDISYYFGPNGKYKSKDTKSDISNENTKSTINEKRKRRQQYVGMLSKLVNNQYIDMLEYAHLLNFLKSGGTLVNLGRYNQIMDKIKGYLNDDNYDGELITKFINSSEKVYAHIHTVIDTDNSSIDIDKFLLNLEKDSSEHIQFTDDQTEGIKNICNFLCDPMIYTYGLYGYAGTGKTTLITKLLHHLLAKNYINSVVFAAPTNKAVNIIKSKFRNDLDDLMKLKLGNYNDNIGLDEQLDLLERKGFKIDFLTIHKLLNYKNDFDHNGERIFVRGNKSTINNYDLIIIDECSMIPFQIIVHLFEEIKREIILSGKDNITKKIPKILFVGDPAQLPPVNEKVSIIFAKNKREFDINLFKQVVDIENNHFGNTDKSINNRFNLLKGDILNMKSTVLKEIVRCNDDQVVGLCNEVRSWVIGLTKEPKVGSFSGVNVSIYKYKKEGKTNTKWFKKCTRYFKDTHNNQHMSNIILTWTNKQADEYNTKIRQTLFNKEVLNQFEIGDILILNDFYNIKELDVKPFVDHHFDVKDKKSNQKRFYTSEQIKVTDIEEVIRCSPELTTSLPSKLRRMENYVHIEDRFKKTVQLINKKTIRKYDVWKLFVHRLTDSVIKDDIPQVYILYVVKNESVDRLEEDKQFAAEKIRELRNYYNGVFKDQMRKIDLDVIKPLWREWNSRFCEPFADVNCGACITTHKSQSSTFYNVFVDVNDILKNSNSNEAKRCIYTALTRVSNELHILI
jgi:hypothetical protein